MTFIVIAKCFVVSVIVTVNIAEWVRFNCNTKKVTKVNEVI